MENIRQFLFKMCVEILRRIRKNFVMETREVFNIVKNIREKFTSVSTRRYRFERIVNSLYSCIVESSCDYRVLMLKNWIFLNRLQKKNPLWIKGFFQTSAKSTWNNIGAYMRCFSNDKYACTSLVPRVLEVCLVEIDI